MAVAALSIPASAAPPGRLRAPGPVGTVDTVAGPGFCGDGPAHPDAASGRPGHIAADASGRVWFQSGDPGEGMITQVVSSASVLTTRTAADLSGQRGQGQPPHRPLSASRLAPDGSGGVLLASPTAIVQLGEGGLTTLSGTRSPAAGEQPASGDGGPLSEARYAYIAAISTDEAGNVYVADQVGGGTSVTAIRFLNRSDRPVTFYPGTTHEVSIAPGTAGTIAGGGKPAGQLVAEAPALAVAGDRLYISGAGGARPRGEVRLLNLGGSDISAHGATVRPGSVATVTTVAGRGRASDGAAAPVRAPAVSAIAADEQGNLFLAEPDNHRVRRVDASGAVTTFAGTGMAGFNGNDRPATQARLDRPLGVAVSAGGRLYITDAGNGRVRVVDQAGTIRASLGNGATSRWACRAAGRPSDRGRPVGLVAEATGNVYMAASLTGQVHRLAPSGDLRPIAGRPPLACQDPAGCPAPDDVAARAADLEHLFAVAPGPGGGLYLVQQDRIRYLNLGGGAIAVHGVEVPAGALRTVVGTSPTEGTAAERRLTATSFTVPGGGLSESDVIEQLKRFEGVSVYRTAVGDANGNMLLADVPAGQPEGGSVRQLDPAGAETVVVAQRGFRPDGTFDTSGCCPDPADLVVDGSGNLYIADGGGWGTGRVWFLNRSASQVVVHGVAVAPGALEAVAGSAIEGSQDEGIPALEADLSDPQGLALDDEGNLYVVDREESTVHRVDARGRFTTVAGIGQPGYNGDGLKGQLTALYEPAGVALDACGNLLIADSGNDRVRRLNLAASCSTGEPAVAPGPPGRSLGPVAAGLGGLAAVAAGAAAGGLAVRRSRRRAGPMGIQP